MLLSLYLYLYLVYNYLLNRPAVDCHHIMDLIIHGLHSYSFHFIFILSLCILESLDTLELLTSIFFPKRDGVNPSSPFFLENATLEVYAKQHILILLNFK